MDHDSFIFIICLAIPFFVVIGYFVLYNIMHNGEYESELALAHARHERVKAANAVKRRRYELRKRMYRSPALDLRKRSKLRSEAGKNLKSFIASHRFPVRSRIFR